MQCMSVRVPVFFAPPCRRPRGVRRVHRGAPQPGHRDIGYIGGPRGVHVQKFALGEIRFALGQQGLKPSDFDLLDTFRFPKVSFRHFREPKVSR